MNISTLTQREKPERHELPASLEALPSPAPRPIQWKRLRENLAILRGGDTTKILDAAYSVGDSIGGMSDERHLRRMGRSKTGRELLATRPSLAEALSDHSALAALPDESLGHHFLSFSVRHGIDSMALLESQHAMSRDYLKLDPVRQWLSDRLTVMHDLWHVLAGYDATPSGESALMCFSLPQRVNDRALPIFILTSAVTGQIGIRDAVRGIRRGMRTKYLPEKPLEEFLPQPLDPVRRALGITPPRVSHVQMKHPDMLIPDIAARQ